MKDTVPGGKGTAVAEEQPGSAFRAEDKTAIAALVSGTAALEALRESDKRLREVIDGAQDVIYRQSLLDATIEYMSPSVQRLLGYTPEEMYAMPMERQYSLFHPEDVTGLIYFQEKLIASNERGEQIMDLDLRMISKWGDVVWIHGTYQLARSADGTPEAIVGTLRDMTERRGMEQALAHNEACIQKLTEQLAKASDTTETESVRELRLIRQVAEGWLQDSESPCLLVDAALNPLVLPQSLPESLRPYFPGESFSMLPETVLDWLRTCAQSLDQEETWTFNHESVHGTVQAFVSVLRMDNLPSCLLVRLQLRERAVRFSLLQKVGLSKREIDVLEHLPLGLTNAQIAEGMSIKEVTVRKHMRSLGIKLEARGRTETLYRAIDLLRNLKMAERMGSVSEGIV